MNARSASYYGAFVGAILVFIVLGRDFLPERFSVVGWDMVAAVYSIAIWLGVVPDKEG